MAPSRVVAGSTIIILAVTLLGFLVWIAFGSRLYYARAQHDAYANFRYELANATAPTGPTDPYDAAKLLAAGTPVAVLSIPKLQLRAVVFQGTTGTVLEQGPGHLRDTQMPGQPGISVIFGRRAAYGAPFAGLGTLNTGDKISILTGQGTAAYQVLDIRHAGDPLPSAPQQGEGRLILVTADGAPFAPSDVIRVDCALVSKAFDAPTMILSAANLGADENILGADPLAWVPIVLWGQCLLAAVAAAGWLWQRWGKWQTWIVAFPVVGYFAICVANEVTRLLPNLM
jgi:LPXTG-site transpeptidase (sortase) family protein